MATRLGNNGGFGGVGFPQSPYKWANNGWTALNQTNNPIANIKKTFRPGRPDVLRYGDLDTSREAEQLRRARRAAEREEREFREGRYKNNKKPTNLVEEAVYNRRKEEERLREEEEEKKKKEERFKQEVQRQKEFNEFKNKHEDELNVLDRIIDPLHIMSQDTRHNAVGSLIFNLSDAIGSGTEDATATYLKTLTGKVTLNGVKQSAAEAFVNAQEYRTQLQSLKQQRDLLIESSKDLLTNPNRRNDPKAQEALQRYWNLDKGIKELEEKLQDPTLVELEKFYKRSYVEDNSSIFKRTLDSIDDRLRGITTFTKFQDPAGTEYVRQLVARERAQKNEDRFDQISDEQNNQGYSLYDKMLNPTQRTLFNQIVNQRLQQKGIDPNDKAAVQTEQAKVYSEGLQAENEEYQKSYDRTSKLQQGLSKFFNMSESYKQGKQLYQDNSLFSPYYWFYVMPGTIGSSNSSPDQMRANIIQGAGTVAAIAAAPFSEGLSLGLMNAGTIASMPGQVQGAVDENQAEIADRRIENVKSLLKDPGVIDGTGEKDILNDLQKQSIRYWRSKGMSEEWIAEKYGKQPKSKKDKGQMSEEQMNNIIQDSMMGITKSNDPRYKKALVLSTAGLNAQFEADMMRTASELPVQFATQIMPMGNIKKAIGTRFDKFAASKIASKEFIGGVESKTGGRITGFVGESATKAGTKRVGERYANGFRKPAASASEAFSRGYEAGSTVGNTLGFGYAGHVVGGVAAGAVNTGLHMAKQMLPAKARAIVEQLGRSALNKYQKIYDKLLPKDWMRLVAAYGTHTLAQSAQSSFSEGAEEGVQYLNSLEDYAEKYGFGGMSIGDLIINDISQGGRVLNAYLSLLGLSDSELKDDKEFWQNVKGGFALGGMHAGVLNIVGDTKRAVEQYKTDQVLINDAVLNREYDKMNRAANVTFARQAMNNHEDQVINYLSKQQTADSRREDPNFTQEDYDDRIAAAKGIMAMTKNPAVRKILESHGIRYGSEKYAHAIADLYNLQEQLIENQKQRADGVGDISRIYNSKEFTEAVDKLVEQNITTQTSMAEVNKIKKEAGDAAVAEEIKAAEAAEMNTKSPEFKKRLQEIRTEAEDNAEKTAKQNAKQNITTTTHAVNKLRALLKLKARHNTIQDWYDNVISKVGPKVKRQDSKAIVDSIQQQIDDAKATLKEFVPDFNDKASDADILAQLETVENVTGVEAEEIEQLEAANAMLIADEDVTKKYLNSFYKLPTKEEKESQKKSRYSKRIDAIIETNERNAELDWIVSDIFEGDSVNKLQEEFDKEDAEALAKAKKEKETAEPNTLDDTIPTSKSTQTSTKPASAKKHADYSKQKTRAKARFRKNMRDYKKWKRGNLQATIIPLQDTIVKAVNSFLEIAEIGYYSFKEFVENVKDASDNWSSDFIPALKKAYISKIASMQAKGGSVENLDSIQDVLNYGNAERERVRGSQIKSAKDFSDTLYKLSESIVPEVSTYYDAIVKDGDSYKIYANDAAISYSIAQSNKNGIVKGYTEILREANTDDETFKNALTRLANGHPTINVDEYVKYRNVNGIEDVVARAIAFDTPGHSVSYGEMVRKAVLAVLDGRQPDFSEAEKPVNGIEEFVKDIKTLESRVGGSYKLLDLPEYAYGDGLISKLDLMFMNDEGSVIVIDIRYGYDRAIPRWHAPATLFAPKTIEEQQNDHLQQIQQILQSIFDNIEVKALATLPIVLTEDAHDLFVERDRDGRICLMPSPLGLTIQQKQEEEIVNLNKSISLLTDAINSKLDEYSSLFSYAKEQGLDINNSIDTTKIAYAEETDPRIAEEKRQQLQRQYDNINSAISEIKDKLEVATDDDEIYNDWVEYNLKYLADVDDDEIREKLSYLYSCCDTLDECNSLVPNEIPTTDGQKNGINNLLTALFDAQNALDYVLQTPGYEAYDLSKEEELIASTIERIVQHPDVFGNRGFSVQEWWKTNFGSTTNNTVGLGRSEGEKTTSFINKINSWVDTLKNHVLRDLDNSNALQEFYTTLLNIHFNTLLNNAQQHLDSGEIQDLAVRQALSNSIQKGRNLITEFNLQWGSWPEGSESSAPFDDEVVRINRMPVRWKDLYGVTTAHMPSIDQMSSNGAYYYFSNRPDFLTKAKFNFEYRNKEVSLHIQYGPNNYADFTFVSRPIARDGSDVERTKIINRANKRFIKKIKAMLDYIAIHPEYKIDFVVKPNLGSIRYDDAGKTHNVSEFLFAESDEANAKDLYTITLSKENDLGILAVTFNKTNGYYVYTGSNLKTPLGNFDSRFSKQTIKTPSGTLIYFYKQGANKIGVPIPPVRIGKDSKKLVDLMLDYIRGNDTIDGYNIIDLLSQRLYVLQDRSKLSKFNKADHIVTLNRAGGEIIIGNVKYPIDNIAKIVEEVSELYQVVDTKMLNEKISTSADPIFSAVATELQTKDSVTLPNGLTFTKDDVSHKNADESIGSTWLGYLMRNTLVGTSAVAKRHVEIYIDDVKLVKKDSDQNPTPKTVSKNATDLRNRTRTLTMKDFLKKGLNAEVEESEIDKNRAYSAQELFVIKAKEYFSKVLGDSVEFQNVAEYFLDRVSDTKVSVGKCTADLIKLSRYAPEESIYHEAFHRVIELLMDDKDREAIYDAYRKSDPSLKTTRQIAEEMTDDFTNYMLDREMFKSTRGLRKIALLFKRVGFGVGLAAKLGIIKACKTIHLYRNINRGKYSKNKISQKNIDRFISEFGEEGLNYTVTIPGTNVSANFKHLSNIGEVQSMARALAYYILESYGVNEIDPNTGIVIDENSITRIDQEVVDELCGNNLKDDELDNVHLAYREVFEYEKVYVKGKKNSGGWSKRYPKFAALSKYVADYVAGIMEDYRDKTELQEQEDDDEDESVQKSNIDKFDKVAYEFSKLSGAGPRVKLFFATIPYHTFETVYLDEEIQEIFKDYFKKHKDETEATINGITVKKSKLDVGYVLGIDYSKNEFCAPTYMPIKETFNILVDKLYDVKDIDDLDKKLKKLSTQDFGSSHGAAFQYIYNKFHQLYSSMYEYDDNGNIKSIDYDKESLVVEIFSRLKSQQMGFVIARSEKAQTGKQIKIIETSTDRDSKRYASTWNSFLLNGVVDVFSRVKTKDGDLQFLEGKQTIFDDVADYFEQLRSAFSKTDSIVNIDGIDYNKDSIQDLTLIKKDIIRKLNSIGIMLQYEALDYMLLQKYGSSNTDGIISLLFQNEKGKSTINAFLSMLRGFTYRNAPVMKNLKNGYSQNGFVKMLGQMQGAYRRLTVEQNSLGLDGKKLYNISQNNSLSHILNELNTLDKDNETIDILTNFDYNVCKKGETFVGSIILKSILNKEPLHLTGKTYIGFKTDNFGDLGKKYLETATVDDYMAKLSMLQQGYLILPTLADKSTWTIIEGLNIPGMTFDNSGSNVKVSGAPTIQIINKTPIIRPSDAVLDQMIEYAETERLSIQQCMEDLGYTDIDGYEFEGRTKLSENQKIKNYHTARTDGVEPNGTRFLSLTEIVVLQNGEFVPINLNNPKEDSVTLLRKANENFFNKSLKDKRDIMAYTLHFSQTMLAVQDAVDQGIVTRETVSATWNVKDKQGNNTGEVKSPKYEADSSSLFNLQTEQLNEDQITAITNVFMEQMKDKVHGTWAKIPESQGSERQFKRRVARSFAIAAILSDANIRSIICSQETLRCFIGHPAAFKVDYDMQKGEIKDSTYDIQKRIGGLVSTGEDNALNLSGIKSTYTCAEFKDYKVSSTSDIVSKLDELFKDSSVREMYAIKTSDWDHAYSKTADELIEEVKARGDEELLKSLNKAKDNAKEYSETLKHGINVADGAAYITADMCENMLRMRGAYNNKVKRAFEILRDEETKYSWKDSAEAYNIIYNAVNIVTTKYTAYGFRRHSLNDEQVSNMAVPYYNKFALFPLFPCVATGNMSKIYQKMLDQGVDMLLMDSAVKLGSQGSVSVGKSEQELSKNIDEVQFNKYTQSFSYLRRQQNTDPEEGDKSNIMTQVRKIVLQNLRPGRTYTRPDGTKIKGDELFRQYMQHYKELSDMGVSELNEMFMDESGNVDPVKLSNYLKKELGSRNASKSTIEAVQVVKNGDKYELAIPLSATPDASWIESILISTVNKRTIDVNTLGNSFVQRSVFAMENSRKDGEGSIRSDADMDKTINGGERLQMINDDGSMDAVISIDYFESLLPKGLSFNEARNWLIKNGIIGPNAKANTIGYRIPTQAESSIHALRFVDVIPAVKSTIILPQEFTKITGSDFDIDHLYLTSYNYKKDGDTLSTTYEEGSKEYHQNQIVDLMLTLLKDYEFSLTQLFKSIDSDTQLIHNVADLIKDQNSNKARAYNFGALHEQVQRKNDYITGKVGIGPFALNVTSQELCRLCELEFRDSRFAKEVGLVSLHNIIDDDDNMITSFLSGFINGHVDIVKDPYISKINANHFTYNMLNLLVRCGFGEKAMWFICQPIIRDMAHASEQASSQYMRDKGSSPSIYKAQEKAVAKTLLDNYLSEDEVSKSVIDVYTTSTDKRHINKRIYTVNYIFNNVEVLKAFAMNPYDNEVTVNGVKYTRHQFQKDVFYTWKALEKYAIALSDLVQRTKIDTKKHGKSLIDIYNYLAKYNKLFYGDPQQSLWDEGSLRRLKDETWIGTQTENAIKYPFKVLGGQTFAGNEDFIKTVYRFAQRINGNNVSSKTLNTISKSLQTAIKSRYFVSYVSDYLIPNYAQNRKNKDFNQYITDLLVGDFNINIRFNRLLNKIQNDPKYSRLAGNGLIQQLYSVVEENDVLVDTEFIKRPSFVSVLDSVDDSKINSDILIGGWEELLSDEDKMVQKFARDLIIYAFMTSGEYKGWNKLFKFVPPAWIKGEIDVEYPSFSDYIRRQLDSGIFGDDLMLDEIVMNNYADPTICPRIYEKDEDGKPTMMYKSKEAVILNPTTEIKDYIAIKKQGYHGTGPKGYDVYKLVWALQSPYDKKVVYPIYVQLKKKGYKTVGFDIYEYGWEFNYAENGTSIHNIYTQQAAVSNLLKWLERPDIALIILDRIHKNNIDSVANNIIRHYSQDPFDSSDIMEDSGEYGTGLDVSLSESQLSTQQNSVSLNDAIQKHSGYWTRQEAQNNPRTLYVFTDNTDRNSGSQPISDESWYAKVYGKGHHYPSKTAAVVRGLENSRPISTMHYFYKDHGFTYPEKDRTSQALWHDSDVDQFKAVIESELQDIVTAWNSGQYDTIMFPDGDGLFNTNLSNITKERTPVLYQALADLLHKYGFDSLIPEDATLSSDATTNESADQQTLTISPAQAVDKKATAKGSISNKFIGFADGIAGSSTAEYARQAGDKANVGTYNPNDTVFVSIPGMRGNEDVRHREQQRTIDEALKALNQGATLITDNEDYTKNSSYNEGEKKLAQALKDAGATYSERTVDGQKLGVWKLQKPDVSVDIRPQNRIEKMFNRSVVGQSERKYITESRSIRINNVEFNATQQRSIELGIKWILELFDDIINSGNSNLKKITVPYRQFKNINESIVRDVRDWMYDNNLYNDVEGDIYGVYDEATKTITVSEAMYRIAQILDENSALEDFIYELGLDTEMFLNGYISVTEEVSPTITSTISKILEDQEDEDVRQMMDVRYSYSDSRQLDLFDESDKQDAEEIRKQCKGE